MGWLSRRQRRRAQRPESRFYVRTLDCVSDIAACEEIAAKSGGAPFTRQDIRFWMRDDGVILLAVINGRVVGFVVYSAMKTTLSIIHIAVAEDLQLRGLGRQLLLAACLHDCESYRVPIAEVCETDTAVAFFKACGFEQMGDSKHFADRRDDNRPQVRRGSLILRLPYELFDQLRRPTLTVVDHTHPA